jgi:two-component system, chemotaxis family, CheB/CheR fusion protein
MNSHEQRQSGRDHVVDAVGPPTVVAIGASAGGLRALERLFEAIPVDSGLAFVVVVHLSPDHASELPSLLQRHTAIPVAAVVETVPVEANHIYVIPPAHNLEAVDTHLRITELESSRTDRAPIDHFFRTVARSHDGNAVALVLTGTGSDGALGMTAIKEQGGITIVQDPADAEHSGMPDSAIATGSVDLVLPLDEIPAAVLRVTRVDPRLEVADDSDDSDGVVADDEARFQALLGRVRSVTGRDFSRYRRATLVRRLQRRMRLHHLTDLTAYVDRLQRDVDEVHLLADDFLITVSSFFRDRETFERLATLVLPDIFRAKAPTDEVRVWTAGCAGGEEAYTLAMLLIEEAERHPDPPNLQVFATDLHEGALVRARHGYFPADISADVSSERLDRFFRPAGTGHQICDEVRRIVVFAPHDLLADPPFSDLDLVSCRNLLIYLERAGQDDALATFRYALRPGGWLLLGSSERTDLAGAFELVDADHCLYRRRSTPARPPHLAVGPHTATRIASLRAREAEPVRRGIDHRALHAGLVERYAPPSILISPDDRVVHLSEGAGRWLLHPAGDMTTQVFKLMAEPLAAELRAAVHGVRDTGTPVRTRVVRASVDGADHGLMLDVQPGDDAGADGYVLVLFNDLGPISDEPRDPDQLRFDAEHARDAALRRLENVIEQHEAGKQALQASNEELQSSNEELRSTLEELETSKEELQSMNEELRALNQENRHKVDELARVTADLDNLLTSTQIATIFVDRELRILRFTRASTQLFNLRESDRGRPLSDITHRLSYDDLDADARSVLGGVPTVEREVTDGEHWYLARLLPYRSSDGRVTGVVMTFIDITRQKHTEGALRESEERLRRTADQLPVLVWSTDSAGRFDWINQTFADLCGCSTDDLIGQSWSSLVHADDIEHFGVSFDEAVRQRADFHDEARVQRVDGEWRWFGAWARPRSGPDGEFQGHLGVCTDLTERRSAESVLRSAAELAEFRARLLDAVRTTDDDPYELEALASRSLGEHLGASRVLYADVDEDIRSAVVHAGYHADSVDPIDEIRFDELMSGLMPTVREGGTAVLDDAATDGRLTESDRRALAARDVVACVIAPVPHHGHTVAVMIVQRSVPWSWSSDELAAIEEAADRTWAAVERSRAVGALRRSEAQLRQLLAAAPGVVFTATPDGIIDYVIGRVDAVLGGSEELVIGTRMWPDLIHPADRTATMNAWMASTAAAERFEARFRLDGTGDERWVMVSAEPFRDRQESVVQWYGLVTDVTALTRAERALHELNDQLEQRVEARTDQVRSLATSLSRAEHEERRRLSQVLHDDLQQQLYGLQFKLDGVITSLRESTEVDALVERLTDLSDRVGGIIDITRNLSVDLSPPLLSGDRLEDAITWLAPRMKELHGLEIEVTSRGDPIRHGDSDLIITLFQIVRELLFNVAKHAGADHATVRIDHTDHEIVIEVEDGGEGFEVSDLEGPHLRGAGLRRARERLQLLNGGLDVASHPGDGTTVTVRVPTVHPRTDGADRP